MYGAAAAAGNRKTGSGGSGDCRRATTLERNFIAPHAHTRSRTRQLASINSISRRAACKKCSRSSNAISANGGSVDPICFTQSPLSSTRIVSTCATMQPLHPFPEGQYPKNSIRCINAWWWQTSTGFCIRRNAPCKNIRCRIKAWRRNWRMPWLTTKCPDLQKIHMAEMGYSAERIARMIRFLRIKGQILFENGCVAEALSSYESWRSCCRNRRDSADPAKVELACRPTLILAPLSRTWKIDRAR